MKPTLCSCSAAFSDSDREEKIKCLLKLKSSLINSPTRGHKTLLHIAAEVEDIGFVKFLIECGADVTMADRLGNTCLHRAATSSVDCMEKVVFFLQSVQQRIAPIMSSQS